jgi:cytochrome P450
LVLVAIACYDLIHIRTKTVSVIGSCIIALLHHPSILAKAQAQVDAVLEIVSDDSSHGVKDLKRLPLIKDKEKMPYITAIALESLRWRDVTPVGESF